ncbi:MAG: DUF6383 domain-containing protein [Porphyromonadaceae bacterium]|nr:DUF6383 domain-containing protein [Porphyromonadaceae bacterium]
MRRKTIFIALALLISVSMISQTYYGMSIGRVEVNSENASNIIGEGISGTIIYDSQTNTLTLRNATIETDTSGLSNNKLENLTINLEGNNVIKAKKAGVSLGRNTTISGSGTLNTTSESDCGIYLRIFHLTIKGGCSVTASGKWGIAGFSGKNDEALTIESSTVTATGTSGSICDISAFTLINSVIREPVGAIFNNRCIEKDGVKVTQPILITPKGAGMNTTIADIGINVYADNGVLHINTNKYINDTLVIYNISGQVVHTVNLSVGKAQIAIPKGIYIIHTGEATEKIIVQ